MMKKLLNTLSGYVFPFVVSISLLTVIGLFFLLHENQKLSHNMKKLRSSVSKLEEDQQTLVEGLPGELARDHWRAIENIGLRSALQEVEEEIEILRASNGNEVNAEAEEIYTLYESYKQRLIRNSNLELDSEGSVEPVNNWGNLLLERKFTELKTSIEREIRTLDDSYETYLASLPPPPAPAPAQEGEYSYVTVNTEKGSFGVHLMKFTKSQVTVKTVAAIKNDCKNDCATKSLTQYIEDNNAYAGMAGSYVCPADYEWCADKTWSFDFALYDSNDKKWLNSHALSWGDTGMMVFSGRSSSFYRRTSDYGGQHITAGISNFPSLVENGNIVVNSSHVNAYQETKGVRGAIGTDDNNVYLAYVTGASVIDAAYAMRALGAKNVLNLDGGGTSAMYINGSYVVGPGRPLATAVLIVK